jgi:adenylyl-sulfate kinase
MSGALSDQHEGRALTVWLTGLSGAGKTTTGLALVEALGNRGVSARLLDGDRLRAEIGGLGYGRADRAEQVRRAGDMALELAMSGTVAVAALVSPFAADREQVRVRHAQRGLRFVEVWLSTPLHVCEARDPKGLYRRARLGLVRDMTGLDQQYEAPLQPDVEVSAESLGVGEVIAPILSEVLPSLWGDAVH